MNPGVESHGKRHPRNRLLDWAYCHKFTSWFVLITTILNLLALAANSFQAGSSVSALLIDSLTLIVIMAGIGYVIDRAIFALKSRNTRSSKVHSDHVPDEYRQQYQAACSLQAKYNKALKSQSSELKRLARERRTLSSTKGKFITVSGGVTLHERWIKTPQGQGPIFGVRAEVEDHTGVSQRLTATRMLTLGIFALAAPKSSGYGSAYVKIEGPKFSGVASFPNGTMRASQKALALAARINNAARWAEEHEDNRMKTIASIARTMSAIQQGSPELFEMRKELISVVSSLPEELKSEFPEVGDFGA